MKVSAGCLVFLHPKTHTRNLFSNWSRQVFPEVSSSPLYCLAEIKGLIFSVSPHFGSRAARQASRRSHILMAAPISLVAPQEARTSSKARSRNQISYHLFQIYKPHLVRFLLSDQHSPHARTSYILHLSVHRGWAVWRQEVKVTSLTYNHLTSNLCDRNLSEGKPFCCHWAKTLQKLWKMVLVWWNRNMNLQSKSFSTQDAVDRWLSATLVSGGRRITRSSHVWAYWSVVEPCLSGSHADNSTPMQATPSGGRQIDKTHPAHQTADQMSWPSVLVRRAQCISDDRKDHFNCLRYFAHGSGKYTLQISGGVLSDVRDITTVMQYWILSICLITGSSLTPPQHLGLFDLTARHLEMGYTKATPTFRMKVQPISHHKHGASTPCATAAREASMHACCVHESQLPLTIFSFFARARFESQISSWCTQPGWTPRKLSGLDRARMKLLCTNLSNARKLSPQKPSWSVRATLVKLQVLCADTGSSTHSNLEILVHFLPQI